MSTLTNGTAPNSTAHAPTVRVVSAADVDARFRAIIRSAAPAQSESRARADFETVFDLDYVQPPVVLEAADRRPRDAHRVRPVCAASLSPRPRFGSTGAPRLTRRGRAVVVVLSLAFLLAVTTALGGWATATHGSGTPERVRVITVQPGDSLYGIAADLADPGEIRAMVHRIQELNSLSGASISEGQRLAVPRG